MRKMVTSLLCALLCVALCVPAFAVEMSEPGVLPIVTGDTSYTIVAPDTAYIANLNENSVTSWIKEKTGVQLVFEEIPNDAIKEKVNIMLASNELPDAFLYCGISAADQVSYGQEGMFLALNDLIDKYGVYTKQVFDQQPTLPGAITAPDGNIYALPGINECYHCMHALRAWINQKWLDNLGLAYPTTWSELHDVLVAFKEQDANQNGDLSDEIPLMGANGGWNCRVYDFLFNAFLYYDDSNLRVNNGKVEFTPTMDEYKQAVEAVKAWMDEGLIDKTSLTQTEEQYRTVGSDPSAAKIGVGIASLWWNFLPQDVDSPDKRSRDYVPLSPVAGPEGQARISPTTGTGVGGGDLVICDTAKDPEVLFRVFDYMYSDEATLRAQIGLEGIDYNMPKDGALGINGKPALYEVIPTTAGNVDNYTNSMPNLMLSNRTSDFRLGQVADYDDPETQWSIEPRLYKSTADCYEPYKVDGMRFPTVYMLPEESSELARLRTQIDDYVKEQTALFLTGDRDMGEWDAYLAEFDALELNSYVDLLQKAYDRQYGAEAAK